MARLLYVVAHSTDDPDRAATALAAAAEAAEGGHEVALWLTGEGVRLAVDGLAEVLRVVGTRSPVESLTVLNGHGAGFHVSAPCFDRRGFTEEVARDDAERRAPGHLAALAADGWIPVST